jgi:3-hydroxybutyryl-CoA dehydrogenase
VAAVDYVVEAVPEDLLVKRRVLAEIERYADQDVVVASATTAIPVADLALDCVNPKRVLAVRYTLPAHLIPVVDVVAGPATAPGAVEMVHSLLTMLGKTPVVLNRNAPGGVGPRLLTALMSEALRIVEDGVADPVMIDKVITGGIGRRFGAGGIFHRIDIAGLDTVMSVFERQHRPVPRALAEKVDAGALGRKTGRGFYSWTSAEAEEFDRREARHLAAHILYDRRPANPGPLPAMVRLESEVLDEFLDAARAEYTAATPQAPPRCFAVLIGTIGDGLVRVVETRFAGTVREADDNAAVVWRDAIVPCFGAAYGNERRGFWVQPKDLLDISRAADAAGMDVLGSIHLHPDWHRSGPPAERGLRISERPTPMDRFLIASTGWPVNMICYLEQTPHGLGQTIAAWGPPPAEDPTGPCARLTVQHAIA